MLNEILRTNQLPAYQPKLLPHDIQFKEKCCSKRTVAVLLTLLFSPNTFGNVCAAIADPLPEGTPPSLMALTVSSEQLECEALTDKSVNRGKALTIHQLERVRARLLSNYRDDTLWGVFRRHTINRKVDCMATLGDILICSCLNKRLPTILPFVAYVDLLTASSRTSAQSLGIPESEFSTLVRSTEESRDACAIDATISMRSSDR